jgi:hypothetical protein
MICYWCRPVCPSVRSCVVIVSCGQTVLGMNIRFGAKHAAFIRTSGAKKPIRKFKHLPPYFGGEMGSGYEKMRKQGANVRISRPMWQESRPCCSPDIDTQSLHCITPVSMPLFTPKHEGKSMSILKLYKNANYG